MSGDPERMTFWEHLDELRGCIIRISLVVVVVAIVVFCLKDMLFAVALAPCKGDFLTYRVLGVEGIEIRLVNTRITEQFMVHVKTALYVGVMVSSPYLLYELFRFVSPALYASERCYSSRVVGAALLMFAVGTVVNYFVVFPLTLRFLGTYQVSPEVGNMLTIGSYMDTMLSMNLWIGVMFELPVVSWLLALLGMIKAEWMARYRRQAVVVMLIAAAIITPTTDAVTLFVVALPMWLLYETSIVVVRITCRKQ